MIKIMLILISLSVLFFVALFVGEKYALEGKYPKFTKWWRSNWIGEWKD